jgi:hypothetical protein
MALFPINNVFEEKYVIDCSINELIPFPFHTWVMGSKRVLVFSVPLTWLSGTPSVK